MDSETLPVADGALSPAMAASSWMAATARAELWKK